MGNDVDDATLGQFTASLVSRFTLGASLGGQYAWL